MEYGRNIYGIYYLEFDDTLDVLAVGVGILGGEVDRLANSEGNRLLGLARWTSVTLESSTTWNSLFVFTWKASHKEYTYLAHARERPEQEPARSK